MKKILVLLLFISGLVKSQVVIPKSTTTFSNINAVGSVTVGGNLRVSGSETVTGNAVINKVRVGSTTAPSATLDVTGTMSVSSTATLASTLKLGSSAVLTGGNTGTVAVLSDALFGVNCMALSQTPLDATTYYIGINPNLWNATQGAMRVYMPYNCTLVGWTFNAFTNTSVGTAETSTLSINIDNSPTLLSSAITMSNVTGANTFTATGLSINVNAGSYIEAKLQTPTWVTNPVGVTLGITFWFVRRQ